ncbi:MAG: POTRA domain-containing protein [Gemmataceae bacterium]
MRFLVLAAGLSALFACAGLAGRRPGGEVIGDVRIVGNRTIPTEQVMRHVNLRPGQEYTQHILMEAVDRLSKARLFRSVRPHEEQRTGTVGW